MLELLLEREAAGLVQELLLTAEIHGCAICWVWLDNFSPMWL